MTIEYHNPSSHFRRKAHLAFTYLHCTMSPTDICKPCSAIFQKQYRSKALRCNKQDAVSAKSGNPELRMTNFGLRYSLFLVRYFLGIQHEQPPQAATAAPLRPGTAGA